MTPSLLRARPLAAALLLFALEACTSSAAPPDGTGCRLNGDCAAGELCIGGSCVADTAPACGRKTPCGSNDACASKSCEGGCCAEVCEGDGDCAEGEVCRSGRCREEGAACLGDADCAHNASAPVCNEATGGCVRCLKDADCGTGETCVNRGCRKPQRTGCVQDADCTEVPQLSHCLAATGQCVACLTDQQCQAPGQQVVCDKTNHACRLVLPGCDNDAQCATSSTGHKCRDDRKCVQCLADSDCPGGRCLRDNTCTSEPACTATSCTGDTKYCRSPDRICVECLSSSQCGSGKVCSRNHCLPAVNGCLTNADCAGTELPVCDLTKRSCVRCVTDPDCDGGLCNDQQCYACHTDAECTSRMPNTRFCNAGRCGECISDNDCSGGTVCLDKRCVRNPLDQPCPADGRCPRGLVCLPNGAEPPACRQPCDVYAERSGCLSTSRCALIRFVAGQPVGACLPSEPGSAQAGESCGASEDCDAGLVCVPESATGSRCRRLCDPTRSTTACPTPNACQRVVQTDAQGIPQSVGACSPPSNWGKACDSDATCGAGFVCAPGPDPLRPLSYRNVCQFPRGAKSASEPCHQDGECRSNLCLQGQPQGSPTTGYCQGGCTSDSVCPARGDGLAGACEPYPLPWIDARGLPTTVDVPSCAVQCREERECQQGATCETVPNIQKTAWVTRCRAAVATTGGLGGARCRTGSDCRTGTCITFGSNPSGICEGACGGPGGAANCDPLAACPSTGVLRAVSAGPDAISGSADDVYATAHICWGRACTRDEDCIPGHACAADVDPTNTKDQFLACHPAQGTRHGGDGCAADSECKSGWCVSWSGSGKRCFGACQSDSDCAQGRCRQVHFPTSTSKALSICAP